MEFLFLFRLNDLNDLRYFDFYPAPDTRYGIIPVWGFGSIVRSTVTQENLKLREGERVYGYFAPTRYLMVPVEVEDGRLGRHSFYVSRPYLPGGQLTRPLSSISG